GPTLCPDAVVRISFDAAPEVRGARRSRQSAVTPPQASSRSGMANPKTGAIVAEMRERDQRDRTRANSPLVPASDAVIIDSTNLSIEAVLDRIREVLATRVAG